MSKKLIFLCKHDLYRCQTNGQKFQLLVNLVTLNFILFQECFHTLLAPRSDGRAVATALQEMDFEVMLFSNLTVTEIRLALELFCELITEQTYALFYFNGHALGHGSDIYLPGKF